MNSFIKEYRTRFTDDPRSDAEILVDAGTQYPELLQQRSPDAWSEFQQIVAPAPTKKKADESDDGDFFRGAKVSLSQLKPLAQGVVGLAGATAEKAVGEGGIATKVKDWGFEGYKEGMENIQPLQRENDDITNAWKKAKEGDIGALVDWAQYGLGYVAGQAGETLAISALGALAGSAATAETGPGALVGGAAGGAAGFVAKGAVKKAAQNLVEAAIKRQAVKLASKEIAEAGVEITGKELVDAIAKKAATTEIRKAAARNIGSTIAVTGNALMMELGTIAPEAFYKAKEEGRELSGADLARVWGTGIAAGGLEAITDKLGLDIAMGKSAILKKIGGGRIAKGATLAAGGAVVEGATELTQTGLERIGAGKELSSDEAINEYVNATALGSLGGGAVGGVSGLIQGGSEKSPQAQAASARTAAEPAAEVDPEPAIDLTSQYGLDQKAKDELTQLAAESMTDNKSDDFIKREAVLTLLHPNEAERAERAAFYASERNRLASTAASKPSSPTAATPASAAPAAPAENNSAAPPVVATPLEERASAAEELTPEEEAALEYLKEQGLNAEQEKRLQTLRKKAAKRGINKLSDSDRNELEELQDAELSPEQKARIRILEARQRAVNSGFEELDVVPIEEADISTELPETDSASDLESAQTPRAAEAETVGAGGPSNVESISTSTAEAADDGVGHDTAYYSARLKDPGLIGKSVRVKTADGIALAVPVGGARVAGTVDPFSDRESAEDAVRQLSKHDGFPNLAITSKVINGKTWFGVQWGEQTPSTHTPADAERLGRMFGYTDAAINEMLSEQTSEPQPAAQAEAPSSVEAAPAVEAENTGGAGVAPPAPPTTPTPNSAVQQNQAVSKPKGNKQKFVIPAELPESAPAAVDSLMQFEGAGRLFNADNKSGQSAAFVTNLRGMTLKEAETALFDDAQSGKTVKSKSGKRKTVSMLDSAKLGVFLSPDGTRVLVTTLVRNVRGSNTLAFPGKSKNVAYKKLVAEGWKPLMTMKADQKQRGFTAVYSPAAWAKLENDIVSRFSSTKKTAGKFIDAMALAAPRKKTEGEIANEEKEVALLAAPQEGPAQVSVSITEAQFNEILSAAAGAANPEQVASRILKKNRATEFFAIYVNSLAKETGASKLEAYQDALNNIYESVIQSVKSPEGASEQTGQAADGAVVSTDGASSEQAGAVNADGGGAKATPAKASVGEGTQKAGEGSGKTKAAEPVARQVSKRLFGAVGDVDTSDMRELVLAIYNSFQENAIPVDDQAYLLQRFDNDFQDLTEAVAASLETKDPAGFFEKVLVAERKFRPADTGNVESSARITAAFNAAVENLRNLGVKVRLLDEKISGLSASYRKLTRTIAMSVADMANPTHENFVTLLHEAAHDVFDNETPERQAAIIKAITRASDEMLNVADYVPTFDSRLDAEQKEWVRQQERLVESVARNLALSGFSPAESNGIIQRILRHIQNIYQQVALFVQEAIGLNPSTKLAASYFQNRLAMHAAGQTPMSIVSFMGGRRMNTADRLSATDAGLAVSKMVNALLNQGKTLADAGAELRELLDDPASYQFGREHSASKDMRDVARSFPGNIRVVSADRIGFVLQRDREFQPGEYVMVSKDGWLVPAKYLGIDAASGGMRVEYAVQKYKALGEVVVAKDSVADSAMGITLMKQDDSGKDWAVDSSQSEEGRALEAAGVQRYSSVIYQAMYRWAHNNGFKIVPDTETSLDGNQRRNAHQLTSAIRDGSAEHFTPTADQLWRMGLSLNKWGKLSYPEKVAALAKAEVSYVGQLLPGLDRYAYDIKTGTFTYTDEQNQRHHGLGRDEFRAGFVALYNEQSSKGGIRGPIRIGEATARRYLAERAVLQEQTRGVASGAGAKPANLADVLYRELDGGASDGAVNYPARPINNLALISSNEEAALSAAEALFDRKNIQPYTDAVNEMAEKRIAAARSYKPDPIRLEALRSVASHFINIILPSIRSGSAGSKGFYSETEDATTALLDAARKSQEVKAIDFIKMLVDAGLAGDGERYYNDLAGRNGLGQFKFPAGTDLSGVTLDQFLRVNPEMYDDLSGWLDGKSNSEQQLIKVLSGLAKRADTISDEPLLLFRNLEGVSATGTQVSPDVDSGALVEMAVAANNSVLSAVKSMYDAWNAAGLNVTGKTVDEFMAGLPLDKNPRAFIAEQNAKLAAIGKAPVNVATDIASLNNDSFQMRAAEQAGKLLEEMQAELIRQRNQAEYALNPMNQANLPARLHRKADQVIRLTKDYTNADLILNTAKFEVEQYLSDLTKVIANGIGNAHRAGELEQAIKDIEGNLSQPILEQYKNEVNALYQDMSKDGAKFADLLQEIALLPIDWNKATPKEISDALKASNPRINTATRAVIVAFGMTNQHVMDLLRLRKATSETERAARTVAADVFNKAIAGDIAGARAMAAKLPTFGAEVGRILDKLEQEKRNQDALIAEIDAAKNILLRNSATYNVLRQRMAELEKIRGAQNYEWTVEQGAKFLVPEKPTSTIAEVEKSEHVLDITAISDQTEANNERKSLIAKMTKMQRWLDAQPEAQRGAVWNTVNRQLEALKYSDISRAHENLQPSMINRLLAPLTDRLRLIGTPLARQIAAQIYKQGAYESSVKQVAKRLGERWEYIEGKAKAATGVNRLDTFRIIFHDQALGFFEKNQDILAKHKNKDDALNEALRKLKQHYLSNPETADMVNRKGAWDALVRYWKQTAECADWLNSVRKEFGIKIKDATGSFREAIGQAPFTVIRGMNVKAQEVFDILRPVWNAFDTEKENLALAYRNDRASFAAAMQPLFSGEVWSRFVRPIVERDGRSSFYATGDEGVLKTFASRQNVIKAYQKAGGDVVKFAELLWDYEGRRGTVDNFVAETVDTFRSFYWALNRGFAEVDSSASIGMPVPKHYMMDARQNEEMPTEWMHYKEYSIHGLRQITKTMAYNAAYGRNLQSILKNFDAAAQEQAALRNKYIAIEQQFPTLSGKALEKAVKQQAELQGLEYGPLKEAARNGETIKQAKQQFQAFISLNSDRPVETNAFAEIFGTIAGLTVSGPATALVDTISLTEQQFRKMGFNRDSLGMAAGSVKDATGIALQSLLNALRINWQYDAEHVQLANRLGYEDDDARVPFKERIKAAMSEEVATPYTALRGAAYASRAIRAVMSSGFGQAEAGRTTVPTFKPHSVFTWQAQVAHLSQIIRWWKFYENITMRGIEFLRNNPSLLADESYQLTHRDVGMNKNAFEFVVENAGKYGLSIGQMVRGAIKRKAKRPSAQLLTDEEYRNIAETGRNEITLESGLASRPPLLATNTLGAMANPLLGWAVQKGYDVSRHFARNPKGERSLRAFGTAMTAYMFGILPVALAYAWMRDKYDEEILGKKANVQELTSISNAHDALATFLDNTSRVGTFGIFGDLPNQIINSDTQREFSLDNRVFMVSTVLNLKRSVEKLVRQGGTFDWQGVGRPMMSALGGNGIFQYWDGINHLLGADNMESRVVARITAGNYLRVAGRELNLDVRKGAGYAALPTPLKPWIGQMVINAIANDADGFRSAYKRALAEAYEQATKDGLSPNKAREEAKDKVQRSFQSYHPLKTVFQTAPSAHEYRKILDTLSPNGQVAVSEAVNLFNRYGMMVLNSSGNGIKPFTGKESETKKSPFGNLLKMPSLDSLRVKAVTLGY